MFWTDLAAVVVAVASAGIALRANKRSRDANDIAQQALDLEQARDREAKRPEITLRWDKGKGNGVTRPLFIKNLGVETLDRVRLRIVDGPKGEVGFLTGAEGGKILSEAEVTGLGGGQTRHLPGVSVERGSTPLVIIATLTAGDDVWETRHELKAMPPPPRVWVL
jgi:hypothetical protein